LYALLLDLRGQRRMIYAIHRTVVYDGKNSEILFYLSCWEFEMHIVLSKI